MNNSPIEDIRTLLQGPAPAAPRSPTANPKGEPVSALLPTPLMLEPRAVVLRTFLRTILPEHGSVYFAVTLPARDSKEKPRQHACRTIEELADRLLAEDGAGAETYFATASYKREWHRDATGKARQRCRENVELIKACWLDIDVGEDKAAAATGYATQEEAIAALDTFCTAVPIAPTFVVSSGRGLHVYFAFTEPVEPAEWKQVARTLKHACTLTGLRADGSRTEDSASILRPIGCTHRKDPTHPRPVRLIAKGAAVDFGRFTMTLRELVILRRGGVQDAPYAVNGVPDAWSTDRMPAATKILAGLVSSDVLAAGIGEIHAEIHPWLRDLPPDDQFRLLEDACAAVPDSVWSDYEPWRAIIAGLRGLHHLDEKRRLALLQRHSERSPKWVADGWTHERLREKFLSFDGGSVRHLFELAEAHGWTPPTLSPFTEWATAESYFARRFIYVTDQAGYLDVRSRQLIKPAALDESQSWLTTKLSTTPRSVLRRSARTLRADSLGYNPGAGAIYAEDGRTLANLYVPWTPVVLQPTSEEQEVWNWFIYEHLFRRPEDQAMRDYFLNVLAYPLQHPGRRVASVPLLIGEQYGSGKSTLMEKVPRLVFGNRNVTIASQSEIESNFNDWHGNAQIVAVPEIWMGGGANARKIANDLKDKITNDMLRVHPKGLRGYTQANRATILGTSNFENAVHLREGDRRWGIHVTDAPKMTPPQAAALYGLLNSDRAAGVLQYILRNRDLSGFNPAGEPPMSFGKVRVIAASRSPIEAEIVELFQDREPPFDRELFTFEWLIACLRGRIPDIDKVAPRRLAEYVQGKPISAVRLDGRKRIRATRPIEGVGSLHLDGKHGVWCIGDATIWAAARDRDIARHLEDGSPLLSAVPRDESGDYAGTSPDQRVVAAAPVVVNAAREDAA